MKPGDVTELIRTPSGFHIFKLVDVRGAEQTALVAQVHARHILMLPTAVEDDETVRQKLSRIRERMLKGEDFAAIASVSSADQGSATRGGDLGWASPSSFVPDFAREVDALEINEISQPFKTQFGWHIVQLLGRRDYDATTDVTRNKCLVQLREARAEEETEIWARRLRDEAYVEYRVSAPSQLPTVALTTGEPAGIGPDLCAALPGRRLNCRVVLLADRVAARTGPRRAQAHECPARLRPGRPRQGTGRSAARAAGRAVPGRAASIPRMPATCCRCSTALSTAASPASSTRW